MVLIDGAADVEDVALVDGAADVEDVALVDEMCIRDRHWVDYNNPRWIENQDRYSVKSVARLNLDTAAYILAELDMQAPEMMKKLYDIYK